MYLFRELMALIVIHLATGTALNNMAKQKSQNTIPVFLDLEDPNNLQGGDLSGLPEQTKEAIKSLSTDEKVADTFLSRFLVNKTSIGKRIKEMGNLGISYSTKSVHLYHQAKELYSLGYFESAIMVSRSTAEYLAYEIFVERINLEGDRSTIELIGENIDFRKIVNDFLCSKKRPTRFIDQTSKDLFNQIYDLGNRWIHPKRSQQEGLDIEKESKDAVIMLKQLIDSLRNVFVDNTIEKGMLKAKPEAIEKYKRGIKLEG